VAPSPSMTVEEYLRTPESVLPQELVFGAWRAADAPTPRHQSIVFALGMAIERHARARGLGRVYLAPVDVVLDSQRHLVIQPDLVYVEHDRRDIVQERIWGAPDLVAEVLSPRPRIGDLDERLDWFATYGVRECWLIRQDTRSVEVVRFGDGRIQKREALFEGAVIRSAVLPEWTSSLGDVIKPLSS
jgi:Uma2 family endonuclease